MFRHKPTLLIVFAILAMIALGYASIYSSTHEITVSNPLDVPWAGMLVNDLKPDKPIFARVHYSAARNHHFVQVFGSCSEDSFDSFLSTFDLQRHEGCIWNDDLKQNIAADVRGDCIFSEADTGFTGNVKLKSQDPAEVSGAYSRSTHRFFLRLKSLSGAD